MDTKITNKDWPRSHKPESVCKVEIERECRVDIGLSLSMKERVQQASTLGSPWCIFRVPQSLLEINQVAYQPRVVSIGPYHHGKSQLEMMEDHKWRFLRALLEQTQKDLDDFFKVLAPMEPEIREYYSEKIRCNSQELIEMMILDGCFIIELFRRSHILNPRESDDPIFKMSWVFPSLIRDLLQLENQIPFFVLQTLFDLSRESSNSTGQALTTTALHTFRVVVQIPQETLNASHDAPIPKHLLDLLHWGLLPSDKKLNKQRIQLIPSAVKLYNAGVKFDSTDSDCFLNVSFSNGVFCIPCLKVNDVNTSLVLNCVAFEQCCIDCRKDFTDYICFMNLLIRTPEDAGFLSERNIIENLYGTDKEVARLFSSVGKDVAIDMESNYLYDVFHDVNEYYRNNWNVHWAELRHKYFDSPWAFISVVAAVVLLLLTACQTFFAVYAYFLPPK